MHYHFQQSDSRDSNIFEVVRVFLPWLGFVFSLLLGGRVVVEGIAGGVKEFYFV
jgi:hypothetical protein